MLLIVSAMAGTVGACATPPPPIADDGPHAHETAVAVIERGRHTDIALPADALTGPAASLRQAFPGVKFFVFGFGDRAYLMAHGATVGQSIAALFPSPGVILVTALNTTPDRAFAADRTVALRLSCTRLNAVTSFIQRALVVKPGGALQRLGDGPYPGSAFYATGTTYDLLYDCNRWTADALRSGGFGVVSRGVILASQVMPQVEPLGGGPISMQPLAACGS